ncbi:hypothetical protein A3D60_04540 [Candidatus Uhrbacteria bacterium RIFCSPHIGHO2_02_FULL_47_29]|nr:MAG: hypothetical protein A3D60_04540 [Candidatus Uhrbacteria bacterium RIFCSPHIGHO2_02_FULL_47_29]
MWNTFMGINSILFFIASGFLVYAIGAAILRGEWKQLLYAFLVFLFLMVTQTLFAHKSEY